MSKKDIEAIYPLSPSQKGILFETLSAPNSGIHIEQFIITLHEDLNLTAFEQAWQRLVERHSVFRTGFVWEDQNEPLQFVQKRVVLPLEYLDWRGFSSSQQQKQLEVFLNADRRRGFNLIKAPQMRLAIFRINDNAYQFLWTQHHILTDGWCLPLILQEVMSFYKAFSTNQDLSLKPSRPYRDYITWLKQQDLSQAETFWQKTLQGFTKPTPLGITAEPGTFSNQQERYGQQETCLSVSATAALQSLVKQNYLTLNNLVQGLWALLLSRYSGELDVVFGTTVSGRPPTLAGVESMIGLFINTLPTRVKVVPDASLWSWLKNIQLEQIEQRVYEYCSTGQVHQWSEIPGSLPLYESILVFENYPDDLSTELTVDVQSTFSKGAQTKYALTILVVPGSKLEFTLIYDSYRLDKLSITWILEHFLALLNSVAAVRDQLLATLLDKIPSDQIPQVRLLQERSQQELKETFVAPRDTLELQLAQIWEEVLDVHPIGVRDNFFDFGGHSLLAIRLMSQIQQQLSKELPLTALFSGATIEQLANVLRSSTDSSPWSPLVAIQPNGSKRPFFYMPGSGGTVIYLYQLACHLGLDQPFYGLQARGIDGEQPPHTQIEEIAAYNIKAIQTIQPQGPYLLGGHSFGTFVTFEMALQLQQQGQEVALLALMDTPAPINHKPIKDEKDDAAYLVSLVQNIEDFIGKNLSVSYEDLQKLEEDEQLNYVLERLKIVSFFPTETKLKQLRGFLQVFKANHLAQYVPQSAYLNRITVFQSQENKDCHDQPAMGWDKLSSVPVETYLVPGDHITMMTEPYVQVLAEKLRASLEQVQAEG